MLQRLSFQARRPKIDTGLGFWRRYQCTKTTENPLSTFHVQVKRITEPSKLFGIRHLIGQIQGSNRLYRFTGQINHLESGDRITVSAVQKEDPKSGFSYFDIKNMEWVSASRSPKELLSSLPSIGPKSQKMMTEYFGEKVYDSLLSLSRQLEEAQNESKTHQILSIHKDIGITAARLAQAIRTVRGIYERDKSFRDARLPHKLLDLIFSQLKRSNVSWQQFSLRPFHFANEGVINLPETDEFFKTMNGQLNSPERITAYIVDHLKQSPHTWEITYSVAVTVAYKAGLSPTSVMEQLVKLSEHPDQDNPLGFSANRLFLKTTQAHEAACTGFIEKFVGSELFSPSVNSERLQTLLSKFSPLLTAQQKRAVSHVFRNNLTTIFGNNGNDKFTVLTCLIQFLHENFGNVVEVITTSDEDHQKIQCHGFDPKTTAQFIAPTKVKPKVLIVYQAGALGLKQWNALFASENTFSLEKLILIGGSHHSGKGHVFWSLLTNPRTQFSLVTLDEAPDFNVPENHRAKLPDIGIIDVPRTPRTSTSFDLERVIAA